MPMSGYCTCSECGEKFYISLGEKYQYKVNTSRSDENKDLVSQVLHQCCYTCYDHAKLRFERYGKRITKENYNKYVLQSEEAMKRKGKTILHPLSLKEIDD